MKPKLLVYTLLLVNLSLFAQLSTPPMTWGKMDLDTAYSTNWRTISLDENGSKMLATIYHKEVLFFDQSQHSTWTVVTPNTTKTYWKCADISRDGSTMVVGSSTGHLYRSTDNCNTWTDMQPDGENANRAWQSFAMSEDGTTMIAAKGGELDGQIFISTDGGETWTTPSSGLKKGAWNTTAMSDDGKTMVAAMYSGKAYISTNSGSTWSEAKHNGTNIYADAASISEDGTYVVFTNSDKIYISNNNGTSYTETQINDCGDLVVCKISSNGATAIVATKETEDGQGRAYLSTNFGSSWTETQPAGDEDEQWTFADLTADGTRAMICAHSGNLFGNLAPFETTEPSALVQVDKQDVSVYPNPVTDQLHFTNDVNNINQIVIYNALGTKVKSFNNIQSDFIDVSNLTAGIYVLSITRKEGIATAQFIKE